MRLSSLRNAELFLYFTIKLLFLATKFYGNSFTAFLSAFSPPYNASSYFIAVNKINIVYQAPALNLRLLKKTLYDKWSVSINHLICFGIRYA